MKRWSVLFLFFSLLLILGSFISSCSQQRFSHGEREKKEIHWEEEGEEAAEEEKAWFEEAWHSETFSEEYFPFTK